MMALIAKNDGGGSGYEPVPAGLHKAICYAVYDLGHQVVEFQGQTKVQHKVMVAWELPEERMEYEKDGEQINMPRVISKEYTLSLHEKANLRADLVGWRGREFTEQEEQGFDLTKIVGKPCQINVIHRKSKKSGNTYANIAAIMQAPKDGSMKGLQPENPQMWYDIESEIPPDTIPEWIVKKIMESNEKKGIPLDVQEDVAEYYNAFEEDLDSDLPF